MPVVIWKIIFKGRVQGVGFRWYVQRVAHERGISGYVKNLADGTVESVVHGESHLLRAFVEVIESSSPGHVENTVISESQTTDFQLEHPWRGDFEIRY